MDTLLYENSERYSDPTAGAALSSVRKEEKKHERKIANRKKKYIQTTTVTVNGEPRVCVLYDPNKKKKKKAKRR